jgi:hypothetical protein
LRITQVPIDELWIDIHNGPVARISCLQQDTLRQAAAIFDMPR